MKVEKMRAEIIEAVKTADEKVLLRIRKALTGGKGNENEIRLIT